MTLLISLSVFLAISFLIFHIRRKETAPTRLDVLLKQVPEQDVRKKIKRTVTERIENYLELAGIFMPAFRFIAIAGIVSATFFTVGAFFFTSIVWGLVFMLLGVIVIFLIVSRYRGKRNMLIEAQMVTAVSLIASGMRAGASFSQSIVDVSEEVSDPIKTEFLKISRDISQGLPPADAVDKAADILDNPDLKIVATASKVTSQSGGNLPEILDSVVETIYDRQSLRSAVKAYTAEGRISGYIVGVIPFGVIGFVYLSNPSFYDPIMESAMGRLVFAGAVALIFVGWFWISRITKEFDSLY